MTLRDETGKLSFLTVKHLLAVVGILTSLTFGLFTYTAGRAMDKLDHIDAIIQADLTQDAVQQKAIDSLEIRMNKFALDDTEHEKRLIILETMDLQRGFPAYDHRVKN